MTNSLNKSVFFAAPPETVWAFLVEQDKLGTWYHAPEADLSDGQPYQMMKTADDGSRTPLIWGEVLQMEQPNKLVTTFEIEPFNGTATTLTWTLAAVAGGTMLKLAHEGIETAAGAAAAHLFAALDKGWDAHFADLRAAA